MSLLLYKENYFILDSKGNFKLNLGLAFLKKIVDRLGNEVHQFIKDMIKYEKELKNSKFLLKNRNDY